MLIGRTDSGFVVYNYHEGTVTVDNTDLVFTGVKDLQQAVKVAEDNLEDYDTSVVQVKVGENGTVFDVSDLVPVECWDLVEGKIFPDRQDMQNLFMVLGTSRFELEHGLRCPADVINAIEYIKGLKSFK